MFQGEVSFKMELVCPDCGKNMPLQVITRGAVFYLGHYCSECGPWDRTSGYFTSKEAAEKELDIVKKHGFAAGSHTRAY
jgi:hypothetical protein